MTQPYLAAMVLPVLAAAALTGAGAPVMARATALAAAIAATVTGFWLSGLFVLQGAGSLASGGLGYYSMNLLAPISPHGWSAVLPELPRAGDGQAYEGFQYLGLGNLVLIAGALLLARRVRRRDGAAPDAAAAGPLWTPAMVAVCVLMAAFAVSPTITLGSRVRGRFQRGLERAACDVPLVGTFLLAARVFGIAVGRRYRGYTAAPAGGHRRHGPSGRGAGRRPSRRSREIGAAPPAATRSTPGPTRLRHRGGPSSHPVTPTWHSCRRRSAARPHSPTPRPCGSPRRMGSRSTPA